MKNSYLTSVVKQLEYYKSIGEKTLGQLNDEQLFWQPNQESNSIATIVQHLRGNMLSRWTDFLTTDGEKASRNRDTEFINDVQSKNELLLKWNEGWDCLLGTLNSLTADDLEKEVFIRNEPHLAIDAINRQLAHYPYHIGQMVYIGKILLNDSWKSLSIPRGESDKFNAEKAKEAGRKQ